jgi:hypothetical protein
MLRLRHCPAIAAPARIVRRRPRRLPLIGHHPRRRETEHRRHLRSRSDTQADPGRLRRLVHQFIFLSQASSGRITMPDHHTKISGTITHIFAHRFVVTTARGAILADLTPHGAAQVSLHIGDDVTLDGELKPSELKVTRFTCRDKSVSIDHKKHHPDHRGHHNGHHPHADPAVALAAARDAGFETAGEPQRKPKHFEILGRRNGEWSELHVELDGHIRKSKPVAPHDRKWSDVLTAAS